jgi:hypothetical protein
LLIAPYSLIHHPICQKPVVAMIPLFLYLLYYHLCLGPCHLTPGLLQLNILESPDWSLGLYPGPLKCVLNIAARAIL